MPNETHLKRLISDAVFEAHNTHGRQVAGDWLHISREDSRIIASAVFDTLRRANVLLIDQPGHFQPRSMTRSSNELPWALRTRIDETAIIDSTGVFRMEFLRRRREFITLLGGAISVFLCVSAAAQEGYYGVGHDKWHQGFYSTLKRNDGGSCCNLMDCRPTQSRMVGDHYEVKVDGVWMPVPSDKINNVIAPDGGAHVCAPKQEGVNKGMLFCVILPPDG